MPQTVLADQDYNLTSRLLNLPDGVLPQQPATIAQLQNAIEGVVFKSAVKVAAQVNITLSSPGASIDGQTMSFGDRFLLRNQTAQTENGIYIWNGSAVPATRSTDMSVSAEFNSAIVPVLLGTDAGLQFRQTAVSPVVGTTSVLFVSYGVAAPPASTGTPGTAALATQSQVDVGTSPNTIVTPLTLATWVGRLRKFSVTIGDGTATLFTATHNFNTKLVSVDVYRTNGAFDKIIVGVERPTVNTIQIRFEGFTPALGAFEVVIIG